MQKARISVLIILISASGCSQDDMSGAGDLGAQDPHSATAADLQQLCVDTINSYRAKIGAPAYGRLADKEPCADTEATKDAQRGVAHGAFRSCGESAQDECPGWGGAPDKALTGCLAAMWAEGPGGGHYDNMASRRYTKVSCGFFTTPTGKLWSVQNFQ